MFSASSGVRTADEAVATLAMDAPHQVLMANALGFFSSRFCLLTTLHRLGLLSSAQGAPPGPRSAERRNTTLNSENNERFMNL